MTDIIQYVAKLAIIISVLLFVVLAQYYNGRIDAEYSRLQIGNGVSLGHFLFFLLVGFVWPENIVQALAIGIAFELMEWVIAGWLSSVARYQVLNVIGGWFPNNEFKSPTHWLDRIVFGDYPTDHWWHPRVTDMLLNAIGYFTGRWLLNFYNNK
jgi:hypothetical protein